MTKSKETKTVKLELEQQAIIDRYMLTIQEKSSDWIERMTEHDSKVCVKYNVITVNKIEIEVIHQDNTVWQQTFNVDELIHQLTRLKSNFRDSTSNRIKVQVVNSIQK